MDIEKSEAIEGVAYGLGVSLILWVLILLPFFLS